MKPKVLLVDDDSEFAEMLQFSLARQGFDVVVANNGIEGLNLARIAAPDAILLDFMLPDLDGFSVCQILRSRPRTREVPIIFLSALSDVAARVRGLKLTVGRFFTKPVELKELAEGIRAVLHERPGETGD